MILRAFYLLRRLLISARRNKKQAEADRIRDRFYAQCWREAAAACGGEFSQAEGDFWISHAALRKPVRVDRNLNIIDSPAAVRAPDDKPTTYRLIQAVGAPVPEHVVLRADAHKAAATFLSEHGGPVVVKPASGTAGGVGVTTNIATPSQLKHAMAWAGAYCPNVLVERQITGDTYRLLYLNGELLDCVLRKSPHLVGDGCSTVRKLVEAENRLRLAQGFERSQSLLTIDGDMKAALALQRLGLNSVPDLGQVFTVKNVSNDNSSKENITVTSGVAECIVDAGRRIAREFGLNLVGIDIITSDIRRSLVEMRGAIIDINGNPGFYYHYFKRNGQLPVAEHIIKAKINAPEVTTGSE